MRVTLLLWGHSHGFYEVNRKIWFIMSQYKIQEYTHSSPLDCRNTPFPFIGI